MSIVDLYDEVYEVYGDDEVKFIKDMWFEDNDFTDIVYNGDKVEDYKTTYQDVVFEMPDGRTFMTTIKRENQGYWGDGEYYWDDAEAYEVEYKEIVVKRWVIKGD